MADFTTDFSTLDGWSQTGAPSLSTEGFTSTETSLKITAVDAIPEVICRDDVPNLAQQNRWYYTSFALYIPSWADYWDGGTQWTPYLLDLGDTPNTCASAPLGSVSNSYIIADSEFSGHLECNLFAGDYAPSVAVPDGEWVAVEFAFRHRSAGFVDIQWWINGTTGGVTTKALGGNRAPSYIAFGDDGSFVPPAGLNYYIDDFSYDSNARIGPVDLSAACFGPDCASPVAPPLVPGDATPIIVGAPWKFTVTNLEGSTLTLLERQAYDRTVTAKMNGPWQSTGKVLSESPEINILSPNPYVPAHPEQPFLNEGSRLLYGFRREGAVDSTDTVWKCRFGGIILSTVDDAESDPATTTYTAYDPWQYLYQLPVIDPDTFDYPGPNGLLVAANPGSLIALRFLCVVQQSLDNYGVAHIDMPEEFLGQPLCGTEFWDDDPRNEIEITDSVGPFRIEQGKSVGELWDDLVATGTMDILLRPVYDPINRPGVTSEISIYGRAGVARPGAVMAWDKPGRSLVGVNRLTDGTQRANIIRFYRGQGGPLDAEVLNQQSRDTYWDAYLQQWFPDKPTEDQVAGIADAQLYDRKDGQHTITVSPASERSASPLLEYEPGDRVPVYASNAMRQEMSAYFRVQEIPINISDNGTEFVESMLVVPDEEIGT